MGCLVNIRFERTLFCDDITYEYEVSCAVRGIPSWTMRITVDELTKFWNDTFRQWPGCGDAEIPNQYGKIMRSDTLTQCLRKVLDVPGLLLSDDPVISKQTADLLSIPYGLRHLLQYDGDQYDYVCGDRECDGHDDRYKYLASRIMTFRPSASDWSGLNGVCCELCDFCEDALISCTSYWIRVLPQKVDLLLVSSCNNAFYVMVSDFASNVAAALMRSVPPLDADCAWSIADYLPKEVFLDQAHRRWNAQIVYKYPDESTLSTPSDPSREGDRGHFIEPRTSVEGLDGHFLKQLHALCIQMRTIHGAQSMMTRSGEHIESSSH